MGDMVYDWAMKAKDAGPMEGFQDWRIRGVPVDLVFCKKELQYKAIFAILCACATRYVRSSTLRNAT